MKEINIFQIDDFVIIKKNKQIRQIKEIGDHKVLLYNDETGCSKWYTKDEIKQIKLTSEILKKNRFNYNGPIIGVSVIIKNNELENIEFEYYIYLNELFYNEIKIKTVDELQRLIRCFGNINLANNLKIE